MTMNEWSQSEPNRTPEQVRYRLGTSFTNLQNAYTTGFTAAMEYLKRAIETLPKDRLQSIVLSRLYVTVLSTALNWQAEHEIDLEDDFLLQVASFVQDLWNTFDLQLKNHALLDNHPLVEVLYLRRACFLIAFRMSHYIRYQVHVRQVKLAAYQNVINSLVGHLRFVMEESTPEAEHDKELLDFIRPFSGVLQIPYPINANGADQRAFALLLRTVENFERWLRRRTRM
ncbi:hypothetical protein FS837_001645, partial [Tulasnella sp. UAMH 9824]